MPSIRHRPETIRSEMGPIRRELPVAWTARIPPRGVNNVTDQTTHRRRRPLGLPATDLASLLRRAGESGAGAGELPVQPPKLVLEATLVGRRADSRYRWLRRVLRGQSATLPLRS